jgi:diguanylate cyclase (GGDEF)-like protein
MTLYRQLLLFILSLLMVLLIGALLVKVHHTRSFLEKQLASHAQDTATSLGLSLSPYLAEDDLPTIEAMLNAIFDHGYYQEIRLVDLDGATILERSLPVVVDEVPSWFIENLPLIVPEAHTLLSSGWRQMGSLSVVSHPGYAYKTLWNVLVSITGMFVVTGMVVALLGALALRLLLRPLQRVEKQAEALCNRRYTLQKTLPKTRELRRVVLAMNTMTDKIREMFDEQARVAENLRKSAYSDPLTDLGNRRYLEGKVLAGMQSAETSVHGAFLIAEVSGLLEINQTRGYETGDALLRKSAKIITAATECNESATIARLSGGSFAIYLPEVTPEDAGTVASGLVHGLAAVALEELGLSSPAGHVGGVTYDRPVPIGDLLASADRILRTAQNQGIHGYKLEALPPDTALKPRGEQQWQEIFRQILTTGQVILFAQRVVMAGAQSGRDHVELFSRIPLASGEIVSAGLFVPLAERLQCMADVDRIVLEKVTRIAPESLNAEEIAVNISVSSLKDDNFVEWLLGILQNRPAHLPRLIFEFKEFMVVRDLDLVLAFAGKVQGIGHSIGIDHFAGSFVNFGYLKSLRPRYVKIDRAFTAELTKESGDTYFFLEALTGVAHSLDILVIAEGIESEFQQQNLYRLNIDGFQGYFIDSLREVPEKFTG